MNERNRFNPIQLLYHRVVQGLRGAVGSESAGSESAGSESAPLRALSSFLAHAVTMNVETS